jgi:hypothetical protein
MDVDAPERLPKVIDGGKDRTIVVIRAGKYSSMSQNPGDAGSQVKRTTRRRATRLSSARPFTRSGQ